MDFMHYLSVHAYVCDSDIRKIYFLFLVLFLMFDDENSYMAPIRIEKKHNNHTFILGNLN